MARLSVSPGESGNRPTLVHPADMPLLQCARFLLAEAGGAPPSPGPAPLTGTLSLAGADLLSSWLHRATPRLLAQAGGGSIRLWPNGTRLPVWRRKGKSELTIRFDRHAFELLNWLTLRLAAGSAKDAQVPQGGAVPPPSLVDSTGQAFLMWRIAVCLPPMEPHLGLRGEALAAWIPHHLPLRLGFPQAVAAAACVSWEEWLAGPRLTILECCQTWLRRRWVREWAELAALIAKLTPGREASFRMALNWLDRLQILCRRGTEWLRISAESKRWDLAAPLLQATRSSTFLRVIDRAEGLRPVIYSDGMQSGQKNASRLEDLASLVLALNQHHVQAAGIAYFDEDHAAAQSFLAATDGETTTLAAWSGHVVGRIRAAMAP